MSGEDAPILPLLERLPRARATANGNWRACCPVHDDSTPSLDWRLGDDGRILLVCRAGCTTEDVVESLGASMADLFPPERPTAPTPRPRIVATTDHEIRDVDNVLVAIHRRYDHADGGKHFAWFRPGGEAGLDGRAVTSLPLYATERLADWSVDARVVITEGEKAADALLAIGSRALATVTGAAATPDADVLQVLGGRAVVLWPDADAAGRRHMLGIATRLAGVADAVLWLEPPDSVPSGWDATDALRGAEDAEAVLRGLADRIGEVPDQPDTTDRTDETGAHAGSGRSVPPDDTGDAWPEIEPLGADEPLPPFPLKALPAWMSTMVTAVAANTETDPCMAALTALGLVAAPLSNRFRVVTRSWPERGLNLFTLAVADSGELKSAVFAALDEPLRLHEQERIDEEAPHRRDREGARKDLETRRDVARDALKKALRGDAAARASEGRAPEADGAGEEGDEEAGEGPVAEARRAVEAARRRLRLVERELDDDTEQETPPYALLADDSTQEALQRQMALHDGRVAMVSAESELFLMAGGRYDKVPSLQVYLSGYSGEALRGDRITRELPPVAHPGLSIVISTQPVVLEDARRNQQLQRRGLLARFVYAVPASRAGRRHLAGRPSIPIPVEREYCETLMRVCRIGDAGAAGAPIDLRILGEAADRLERWHDEVLEPRRDKDTGDLGASDAMAAWAGRLHGTVARIAGVLHVATHLADASTTSIEPATVDRAIAIGEWAIEHAFAAFGIDRLDAVGLDALRVRRWYRSRDGRPATFTLRQAERGLRGLQADRLRVAVSRLEQHGYLRLMRTKSGPGGGRPSEVVHIHPDELAAG